MDSVVSAEHAHAARRLRVLLSAYEQKRDLIALGAYSKGSDPLVDQAITALSEIERFLQQRAAELESFERSQAALVGLAGRYR
jgi:flagellum-specific ATP synthase